MPQLKKGDTVSCRVKSASIVGPYRSYDEIISFVIVATDDKGYYLYVPHHYYINGSVVATQYLSSVLGIDNKFLNENIVYISENLVASVERRQDGLNCKICKEFFFYAEANQDDGTLICYACRANPYR